MVRGDGGVVVIWDGKDYYPKLTPKTFGCAKVPSAAAVELRRCAHRPRELSLFKSQARLPEARSTPVCAVLISLSHFPLSGEGFISSIYTNIVTSFRRLA